MTRREIIRSVLEHKRPPYVPWSFGFTKEAKQKLLGMTKERPPDDEILGG